MNLPAAHLAVRIQRMKTQLDVARTVVRALTRTPRCEELTELVGQGDPTPSPLLRKQIARHLRSCEPCGHSAGRLVSPERLLAGLPLLLPCTGEPVEAGVTADLGRSDLGSAAPHTASRPAARGYRRRTTGRPGGDHGTALTGIRAKATGDGPPRLPAGAFGGERRAASGDEGPGHSAQGSGNQPGAAAEHRRRRADRGGPSLSWLGAGGPGWLPSSMPRSPCHLFRTGTCSAALCHWCQCTC